jgi:TonB family protein
MHNRRGKTVSFQTVNGVVAVGLLLIVGCAATNAPLAWGQQELNRKTKTTVVPRYPELAQHMRITGVVKIQVTVAPNGTIKDTKLMGGHPVLASAALDAIKQWRFEPGPEESTGTVEFRFDPSR